MKAFLVLALVAVPALMWAQNAEPIRYQCPGGEEFTVVYQELQRSSRGTRDVRATLEMVGKPRLILSPVESASGAKYSDGYTTLWEKGGEVFIESGSVNLTGCTEMRAQTGSTLSGMFVYFSDSATFTDCATKVRYPVSVEGRYIDLERAYTAQRLRGAAPLFVTIQGTIESQPATEGPSAGSVLVVSRFDSANPGRKCEETSNVLAGGWVLTELNGTPVDIARPPSISFVAEEKGATGFGGCNLFTSAIAQTGNALQFRGTASTMMACMGPSMALEGEFLLALEAIARFEIAGQELSLTDEGGGLRMKLKRQ